MSLKSTLCKFFVLWLLLPGIVAPIRLAAQDGFLRHRRKAFRTGAGITYLLEENFEQTGLPNGWTAGNTAHDYDYTTVVLQGLQSYRQTGTATSANLTSPTFTGATTIEAYFLIHLLTTPSAVQRAFYLLNGTTEMLRISVNTSRSLSVRAGGGTDQATTTTLNLNTTYHVWARYIADTDGNPASAFGSVAFSTTGTRPTSGNEYRATTNGTGTLAPDRVRIGIANSNTWDIVFDRILVSTSSIPNSP